MIFITGDTHGDVDYSKLLKLKQRNLSHKDYLIICGDAAICWSIYDTARLLSLYNDIGCTILFVDGNHENFDMLNQMPLVEYKGALMHQIDNHIFHVLLSWWPDEEITRHDIDNAIANLDKVNNKVDYVITHCCDTHTVIKTFGFRRDICSDQLTFIDKVVDYKHWFFGHYHYDRKINDKKTCLYQDIIEIK